MFSNTLKKNKLLNFQNELRSIHNWSQFIVDNYVNNILINNDGNYIKNLYRITLLTNIKILVAINNTDYDIDSFEYPTFNLFIHKCYIECARVFYNNPYLFEEKYQLHHFLFCQ